MIAGPQESAIGESRAVNSLVTIVDAPVNLRQRFSTVKLFRWGRPCRKPLGEAIGWPRKNPAEGSVSPCYRVHSLNGNHMSQPTRHRIQYDDGPSDEVMRRLDEAEDAICQAMHDRANEAKAAERIQRESLASLLLVVSAQSTRLDDGQWQFAIETADGQPVLEAEDREQGDLNRLTLLAAVRGLESIDGPSEITLLSHNRYLIRSLTDSLPRWRRTDFVWDHFGRRVEVQHADLWRRIDHALGIHEVQACLLMTRRVSRPQDDSGTPWLRTDAAERVLETTAKNKHRVNSRRQRSSLETNGLSGTNRLRDWVLRSAAENHHRNEMIAMIDRKPR